MDSEEWMVGWHDIGAYMKKSAKTARRYARSGMPFFRDPGGRPMAKPSMIDEYLLELNRDNFDSGHWKDEGIKMALLSESDKEQERKELEERIVLAQRPIRGRF